MDHELWERIAQIEERWFRAEGRLKQIEFLGDRAAVPAINQLRYAGRALARVMKHATNDAKGNGDDREIYAAILEATTKLETAEADILDAALTIIEPEVAQMRKTYGDELISTFLPRFPELVYSIKQGVEAVVTSRADVHRKTDHYEKFYQSDFKDLVEIYEDLVKIEDQKVIAAHQRKTKREAFDRGFQRWAATLGTFAVFHGVAFSISQERFKEYFEYTLPLWMIAFIYMTRYVFLSEAYKDSMSTYKKQYLTVESLLVLACLIGFADNIAPNTSSAIINSVVSAWHGLAAMVLELICRVRR